MVCKTGMEPNSVKTPVKLCVEEEQGVLNTACKLALENSTELEVLEINKDSNWDFFALEVTLLKPDVLLICFRDFDKATIEKLKVVMVINPSTPMVLLCGRYNTTNIELLKELSINVTAGFAFVFLHSMNTSRDLEELIYSVARGCCILDSTIMGSLLSYEESKFDISPYPPTTMKCNVSKVIDFLV